MLFPIKVDFPWLFFLVIFVTCHINLLLCLSFVNSAGITEGFSMCAGDFVEVYNDESQEGTLKMILCETFKLSRQPATSSYVRLYIW